MLSCPVCGGKNRSILYKGNLDGEDVDPANYACTASSLSKYFDIMQCSGCRLIYSGFRPSEQVLGKLYRQVVDNVYEQEEGGRCRTFRLAVKTLARLCPAKGKLCEIGSYTGIFLDLAKQQGWDVYGLEISDWARKTALEKRHLRCFSSFEEMEKSGLDCFDSVVMWDVIEHVVDPVGLVKQVSRILKPGGVFGLSTIVLDSISAKVLRGRYPILMEMHLVYFTRRTLSRLLEECGFEIVSYRRHRRYVSYAYVLSKFEVFKSLKRFASLWSFLGRKYFISSVGLRDVYARKIG